MSGVRAAALIALVLPLGAAPAVHGQVPALPGQTVRLTLVPGDAPPLHGVVSSTDSDGWTITLADGALRHVPSREVALAEVLRHRRNTLKGALIGGGTGLLAALLLLAASDDDCDRDVTGVCDAFVGVANNAALVWAPVSGALVGALAGTLLVSERWVPAVHPGDAGVTLRWSLPAGR